MAHDRTGTPATLSTRMLPTDAFFWFAEAATPELRPLVAGLFLLDRAPDRKRFRAAIQNLVLTLPRFRQRVVEPTIPLSLPGWEDDPSFELDYHLREIVLPEPATRRHLLEYASEVFSAPLDHMRPLWEGHLIQGLQGGQAALLLKVHHAVVDGVGSVAMFEAMTQARRDEPVPRRRHANRSTNNARNSSDLARLLNGSLSAATSILIRAARAVRTPWATGERLARGVRIARRMIADFNTPTVDDPLIARSTGIGRRLDSVALSLPRMKRLRKKLGVSLNDLVLTAVSGAVGRYHKTRRLQVKEVNCMVPMNLRRAEQRNELGNRVGAFYVSLPVEETDPLERLRRIRIQTTSAKADRQGAGYQTLMQAVALIPAVVFRAAARGLAGRIHLICSNVPGPAVQRYLAGAKVHEVYPYAPVMLGTPLSIALVSYGSTYGIGIDADPAAIPDPERIGNFLLEEIDKIEARASEIARPKRSVPGSSITRSGTTSVPNRHRLQRRGSSDAA